MFLEHFSDKSRVNSKKTPNEIENLYSAKLIQKNLKYFKLFDGQPLGAFQSVPQIAITIDGFPINLINVQNKFVFDQSQLIVFLVSVVDLVGGIGFGCCWGGRGLLVVSAGSIRAALVVVALPGAVVIG